MYVFHRAHNENILIKSVTAHRQWSDTAFEYLKRRRKFVTLVTIAEIL
jgi:hypothetical protein